MIVEVEFWFQKLMDDIDLDPFTRKYLLNRYKSEGLKLLTVTLPQLSKSVLRSLELGYFDRPTSIAHKGGSLRYFRSLLSGIFDSRTGYVLESVCPSSLKKLRQLCEYFYKLVLPFSDDSLSSFEESFIREDLELSAHQVDREWVEKLRKDFETYLPSISRAVVSDVYTSDRPRPGSGTFSTRVSDFKTAPWYLKRETSIGCLENFRALSGYFKPYPGAPVKVPIVEDTSEKSEVLFVPKDSRGPRVIVREPYHLLCAQLGFHDWITDALERATSNRVNFVDQRVNRELARVSSKDLSLSTLDLKSASDRVDTRIMRIIFRNSPACRFFLNQRSEHAVLPSGRMLRLNKVAGMGSGLTFPLMSLLIYLTIVRLISERDRLRYRSAMRLVYVYGDDIIVPTKYVDLAFEALSKVNLLVNKDKSFRYSHFRESCGADYYNGENVAPVRARFAHSEFVPRGIKLVPKDNRWVVDFNSHARECVKNGLEHVADYLYALIERSFGKLPDISGESAVIGRWSENSPHHNMDETGTYKSVRCLIALPVKRRVEDLRNPYIYLGKILKRKPKPPQGRVDRLLAGFISSRAVEDSSALDDVISATSNGSTYDEVDVPRRVRYSRRFISALSLM